MQEIIESKFSEIIAGIIDAFIDEKIDYECPHCKKPINQVTFEDIESWLKGEK